MVDSRHVSGSPAVQTLTSLFKQLASLPDSSDADSILSTCLGQTKTKKRCQRKVAGIDTKLKQLESTYSTASACRSDEFYDDLTELLVSDHCHQHQQNGPLIRADFDQWRRAKKHAKADKPSSGRPSSSPGGKKPVQQTLDAKIKTNKADTLTSGMNSLAISGHKKNTNVQKPSGHGGVAVLNVDNDDDDEQRIASVGYGRLVRKESVRSSGPIQTEMFKYLTPEQMVDGRLYILTHVHNHAIFKIGWTRTTAEERLNQSNNCYRNDTAIYYESPQPFSGALKAERLIHVHLAQHRIIITKCDKCGLGHTEWFQAPKGLVLDTVKAWEKFMKLPAYELRPDGKMHLNDSISRGLEFSLDRLARLGTTGKYARTSGTSMSDISSSHHHHQAPPPYPYGGGGGGRPSNHLHPSSAAAVPVNGNNSKKYYHSGGNPRPPPRPSSNSSPAAPTIPSIETTSDSPPAPDRPGLRYGKKIRNSFNKATDFTFSSSGGGGRRASSDNPYGYSNPYSAPYTYGSSPGTTTPPRKDSSDGGNNSGTTTPIEEKIEDFFTGMIWKLLPRDIKDTVEDGSVVVEEEEEEGRVGGSLRSRLRDGVSGFVRDVKAGFTEAGESRVEMQGEAEERRKRDRERERQRRRSMGV